MTLWIVVEVLVEIVQEQKRILKNITLYYDILTVLYGGIAYTLYELNKLERPTLRIVMGLSILLQVIRIVRCNNNINPDL